MKLLLIGFDALSPQFLSIANWVGNTSGASELESYSDNPWTGPAWTTIYTGVLPEVHGVTDGWGRAIADSEAFPTPSASYIWDDLAHDGLSVGVFNMPITYPPVSMEGRGSWLVSGFPSPDPDKHDITSPSLSEQILVADGDLIGRYYTDPIQFFTCTVMGQDDARMGAWHGIALDSGEEKVSEIIETISRHQLQVCLRLFKNHPVDVGFCQFSFLDRIGHLFGFTQDESERVERWYGLVDEFVGTLMDELKPEKWIIVSDHGFEGKEHLRNGVVICSDAKDVPKKIEDVAGWIKRQLFSEEKEINAQLNALGYME